MDYFKELRQHLLSKYGASDIFNLYSLMEDKKINDLFPEVVDDFMRFYNVIKILDETFKVKTIYYKDNKVPLTNEEKLRFLQLVKHKYLQGAFDIRKAFNEARNDFIKLYNKDIKRGYAVEGIKDWYIIKKVKLNLKNEMKN